MHSEFHPAPALPGSASRESLHGIGVAERVARALELVAAVEAFAVGGSTVRGVSDRFSDLDLYAYVRILPSEQQRRGWAASLEPKRWKSHEALAARGIIVDCFVTDGVEVDLNWVTVETVERCLDAVLRQHRTDALLQAFVGGFTDAHAFFGQSIHNVWQQRARGYPLALGEAMVRHHLAIEPFWVPGLGTSRSGDRLVLAEGICRVQRHILGILLGLNRRYMPRSYKRLRALVASLPLRPDRAGARLEACFELPAPRVDVCLRTLVNDTFDLVAEHLPQVDVARAREEFARNPALAPE